MKATIPANIRIVPRFFIGYASGVSRSRPCHGGLFCRKTDAIQMARLHKMSPPPITNKTSPTTSTAASRILVTS
jgi:hypothetical protein